MHEYFLYIIIIIIIITILISIDCIYSVNIVMGLFQPVNSEVCVHKRFPVIAVAFSYIFFAAPAITKQCRFCFPRVLSADTKLSVQLKHPSIIRMV